MLLTNRAIQHYVTAKPPDRIREYANMRIHRHSRLKPNSRQPVVASFDCPGPQLAGAALARQRGVERHSLTVQRRLRPSRFGQLLRPNTATPKETPG
jgi:hypothetical protein